MALDIWITKKPVQKLQFFVMVEQLSTSKISSTCPTGVNYISKYAGDLREKSHEVWTWNFNRSRCTAKKTTGGGGAKMAPHGIRVNSCIYFFIYYLFIYLFALVATTLMNGRLLLEWLCCWSYFKSIAPWFMQTTNQLLNQCQQNVLH